MTKPNFFTDKDGKVKPLVYSPNSNGVKKGSIDSSTTSKNPKYKLQQYHHFDDLSESAKEHAIEQRRQSMYDFADDWFSQYDGQIYDSKSTPHFDGDDVFEGYPKPKYYDVASNSGSDFIQFDLEFAKGGEKKLMNYLKLPKPLQDKISIGFTNSKSNYYEYNTQIVFYDDMGNTIDLDDPYDLYRSYYSDEEKNDIPTRQEYEKLQTAKEKWDDLMNDSLDNLRQNYEYQFSDEAISEDLQANDFEYDADGNPI